MIVSGMLLEKINQGSLEFQTSARYAIHYSYVHVSLPNALDVFLKYEKTHPNTYRLETWLYTVKSAYDAKCTELIELCFDICRLLLACDISKLQFEHAHLIMREIFKCSWGHSEKYNFLMQLRIIFSYKHQKTTEPLVLLMYQFITHLKRHGEDFTFAKFSKRTGLFLDYLAKIANNELRAQHISKAMLFLDKFEIAIDVKSQLRIYKNYRLEMRQK